MGPEQIDAKVLEIKSKGNSCIGSKDYIGALKHYGDAIKLQPQAKSTAILHSNRSVALYCLASYLEALNDANRAIELDPSYAKAYGRKILALEKLNSPSEEILEACEAALGVDPSYTPAITAKNEIEEKIRRSQPPPPAEPEPEPIFADDLVEESREIQFEPVSTASGDDLPALDPVVPLPGETEENTPVESESKPEEAVQEDVPAPIEPEEVQEEAPVESEPVETEPGQEDAPVEPETVQEDAPVESEPVQEDAPQEDAPVEAEPEPETVQENAPVVSEPVEEESPAESEPQEDEPEPEAVQEDAPVESEPVQDAPIESEPVEDESPAEPESPVEPEPEEVQEDAPVESEPEPESPVESEPVETEPEEVQDDA